MRPVRNRMINPRRGFSAIELLVVLGIIVILVSIFIPYVLKRREDNYRIRCDDNLRKLGAAFTDYAYAGKNGGDFPRVIYDPTFSGYTCFTGADSPDPFAKDSHVRANDVTASLWLLVRLKLAEPIDFLCPSSADIADDTVPGEPRARSNFSSPNNLSYSYASPFSAAAGYKLNKDTLPPGFPVIADKNPGKSADGSDVTAPSPDAPPLMMAQANSTNHARAGQHVLYVDGHVDFQSTPYCGVNRDNIYTAGNLHTEEPKGAIGDNLGPATALDSYLVPTSTDQPSAPPPPIAATIPATTQIAPTTAPATTRTARPATSQSTQPTSSPSTRPASQPSTRP